MSVLYNKLQARAVVIDACEKCDATQPYFHEPQGTSEDPRSELMEIHHTTIKTNVRVDRHDDLLRRLSKISDQSDDVNKMAITQEQHGEIWNLSILVGRVKPQTEIPTT